ncbi:MAG: efflux RND transporter periplasmic adaptor subunit [Chloroflexi bacterium]|nr:efflux RND transporter periplasmic adaptor subunit [Chloroflexota bacterium]
MLHARSIRIAAAAAVLVLAGTLAYTQVFAQKRSEPTGQPVAVARGNLRLTVTGTGVVKALQASDLSFRSSGLVEEVMVKVGDGVKKGQPLARLETRPLELQVAQAEIALRTAQLNLETLVQGSRPEDITSSQASLDVARRRLVAMEAQGKPGDIAAAAASLLSAQARLDQLRNPTPADFAAAEGTVAAAIANLLNAQAKLEQLRNPTVSDLAAAEAALQSARARLDQLRNPTVADLAAAQGAVAGAQVNFRNAQRKLDELRNPPSEQVTDAEAAVKNAESNLLNTQSNLDKLKTQLNDEKRRRLVEAYIQLFIAREELDASRARQTSAEEIAAKEMAVLLALRAVEAAEADVEYPQAGTTAAQFRSAQAAVEVAQGTLSNARLKLVKLLHPPAEDVAQAEDALLSAQGSLLGAQAKLDQLRNPTAADRATAESAVVTAQAKLDQLRNPTAADIAAAQGAVATAQANLLNAQAKLDQLRNPTAADVAAAEGAVLTAQAKLEQTRIPYEDVDLAAQRASVEQAMAQLARLLQPGTALDIARAQLSVDRSRLDLDQARFNLEHAVLVAPFDGIISKVPITAGASQGVGASTVVMSLVDPSAMQVEVNVDETDVAKVELGQAAIITVEAVGARPYPGRVTAVAPSATTQSGVTTYLVTLGIGEPRGLKAGMTALVNVVYQQRQNVLLVPNRAIKVTGQERTVQLLINDKPEARAIKVGLGDDQRTEVVEGLQEGDQVLVEAGRGPTTATQGQGARFPGAGVPGLGGGITTVTGR